MRSGRARRGAYVAALGASAAVATACSLFVDTSGFDSEDSLPGSDAGLDASGQDAPGPGADDASGADAGASDAGFDCELLRKEARTVLCDRFDDRSDLSLGWSEVVRSGTGTLALEGVGESAFFRATLTPSVAVSRAALRKSLPPTNRRIAIAADLRFANLPSVAVQTLTLQNVGSAGTNIYVLHIGPGGLTVFEQSLTTPDTFHQYTPDGSVQPGTWRRVELGIDFTTMPSTLTVKVDGRSVLAQASRIPIVATSQPSASVGVWYGEPTPAFDLSVDDVLITSE